MTTSLSQSGTPSNRVLVVDDQSPVRNALYRLLEGEGYDVLAASNGTDGLTICRRSLRPIDLLVTDCDMRKISGVQFARECSGICPELCVLYISGSSPDEQLMEELRTPNRRFLAKPFRADDLLRRVREMLLGVSGAPSFMPKRFITAPAPYMPVTRKAG